MNKFEKSEEFDLEKYKKDKENNLISINEYYCFTQKDGDRTILVDEKTRMKVKQFLYDAYNLGEDVLLVMTEAQYMFIPYEDVDVFTEESKNRVVLRGFSFVENDTIYIEIDMQEYDERRILVNKPLLNMKKVDLMLGSPEYKAKLNESQSKVLKDTLFRAFISLCYTDRFALSEEQEKWFRPFKDFDFKDEEDKNIEYQCYLDYVPCENFDEDAFTFVDNTTGKVIIPLLFTWVFDEKRYMVDWFRPYHTFQTFARSGRETFVKGGNRLFRLIGEKIGEVDNYVVIAVNRTGATDDKRYD